MRRRTFAILVGLIAATAPSLHAGYLQSPITTVERDGASSVFLSATPPGPSSTNMGVSGSVDYAILSPIEFHSMDPLELVFVITNPVQQSSETYTEHKIFGLTSNVSGDAWGGFRVEIGLIGQTGGFEVVGGSQPGLVIDPFDLSNSMGFNTTMTRQEQFTVEWTGDVPAGFNFMTLAVHVPDSPLIFDQAEFRLRMTPIPIPEPAAAAMLGVGMLGTIAFRMRR